MRRNRQSQGRLVRLPGGYGPAQRIEPRRQAPQQRSFCSRRPPEPRYHPRTASDRRTECRDCQIRHRYLLGKAGSAYLGELRTDPEGRLLFLGGCGKSKSFQAGAKPITHANNVGWHDDVCDGPVRATVTFSDGSFKEAEPGYVVVAPPNFAPGLDRAGDDGRHRT